MTWADQAAAAAAGVIAVGLVAALAVRLGGRTFVRWVLARFMRRLFADPYHENLWETVTATRRFGPQAVVETELRAASGKLLSRPFGRFKSFPGFDELLFDSAQLARLPTPERVAVEMSVVLGPRAARPLRIDIPVMITGMGHAVALSPRAKQALARGAALAGTATNTGMGPLFEGERRAARSLIIQYNRGSWNKSPEILQQADMVEIQLGQGALAGTGFPIPAGGFPDDLRRAFGLRPGEDVAWVHSRLPGVDTEADLAGLVRELRSLTGGVPIAVKLAAGDRIESDIEAALRAGVDSVTVDGCEGGTHAGVPVLSDDFGLPTFVALCRASRFLAGVDPSERPNLVVSGGLFTPGHFLKALALGADAVAIGTAALFAVGHDQTFKSLPWEPPLDIVWYGRPSARRFDVEHGARSLARYLDAVAAELATAVRALGKSSVAEVDRGDLMAIAPWVAHVAGVRLAWEGRTAPGAAPGAASGAASGAAPGGASWERVNHGLERQLDGLREGRNTLLELLGTLSLGR